MRSAGSLAGAHARQDHLPHLPPMAAYSGQAQTIASCRPALSNAAAVRLARPLGETASLVAVSRQDMVERTHESLSFMARFVGSAHDRVSYCSAALSFRPQRLGWQRRRDAEHRPAARLRNLRRPVFFQAVCVTLPASALRKRHDSSELPIQVSAMRLESSCPGHQTARPRSHQAR